MISSVCLGASPETINSDATVNIVEAAPTTNYATTNPMEISTYGAADKRNALIKFDLSGITGPVTVSSVVITLQDWNVSSGTTDTIRLYRCLRNWVEGEATWNIYSTGNSWSTAGGSGSGTDRAASESANWNETTSAWSTQTISSTTQLCSDVQDMINNGSNYGWIFIQDYTATHYHDFATDDDATPANRPTIVVTYTAGASSTSQVIMVQ